MSRLARNVSLLDSIPSVERKKKGEGEEENSQG